MMSRTGIISSYDHRMGEAFSNDPNMVDRLTRQKYGMSAAELGGTLEVLMGLARGETPKAGSAEQKFVHAIAKQRYNMTPRETDSLLRDISHMPAHERISAYFSAGGRSEVDPSVVQTATRLVSQYGHQDVETSLNERLDKRESNHAHTIDRFTHLKADERTLADVKNRQDLRNTLRASMGADTSKPSFEQMRERVADARLKLADRIELQAAVTATTGQLPNLRETLGENFDIHYLDSASKDLGMNSPLDEVDRHISETSAHFDPDYDVTADLRSSHD